MAFVRTFESQDGSTQIEDWEGVSWHEAPVPGRLHKCSVQTKGWINYFTQVFRCACGAIGMAYGDRIEWSDRNSRRSEKASKK